MVDTRFVHGSEDQLLVKCGPIQSINKLVQENKKKKIQFNSTGSAPEVPPKIFSGGSVLGAVILPAGVIVGSISCHYIANYKVCYLLDVVR